VDFQSGLFMKPSVVFFWVGLASKPSEFESPRELALYPNFYPNYLLSFQCKPIRIDHKVN
jgi:hypothetical protein